MSLIFIYAIFPQESKAGLDKSLCADLVVAKIKAQNPDTDVTRLKPFWEAICDGLIEHIQTSAVVNSTGTGTATVGSGSSAGAWPTTDTNVGTIQ